MNHKSTHRTARPGRRVASGYDRPMREPVFVRPGKYGPKGRKHERVDYIRLPVVMDTDHWRPATRADCIDAPRPCPYVGCKHHLAIELTERGDIVHIGDPAEMAETCVLDVADRGGVTLGEVGEIYSVTRERIRQIEEKAERKIRKHPAFREWLDHDEDTKRSMWDVLMGEG